MELVWRIERFGVGPFACSSNFSKIREIIYNHCEADKYGTTFLNFYDQRSIPPCLDNSFRHLFTHGQILNKELKFGFKSKEILENEFGISSEYINKTFYNQFRYLLDNDEGTSVNVYLVEKHTESTTEIVYDYRTAQLVEKANSYKEFILL